MDINVSDYVWTENPKIAFIIEWKGDNWTEMRQFLQKLSKGWTISAYTTDDRSVLVTGAGYDQILEVGEWLIVHPSGTDGGRLREVDVLMGWTKGRPNS